VSGVQDIRAVCDGIRDRFAVSAVALQTGLKLERSGHEWKACCPFHADRSPSFSIYAGDRRWICFAGCGEGDVLDLVKRAYRIGLPDAIEMLDHGALARLNTRPAEAKPRPDRSDAAGRVWRSAGPAAGTPAEAYLRSRGIKKPLPWTIRFGMIASPKDSGVRAANGTDALPALIALVADPTGRGLGVQRTYLTTDGCKAASSDGKVKFSLGPIVGGAIHLGPASHELIVAEGLEDGLTLSEQLGRSVWVAAGTSMMPRVALPDAVASIVIGADGDAPGEAAAQKAARAFAIIGRAVRIMRPAAGFKDFNAQLMGAR
jgi:DNA primase